MLSIPIKHRYYTFRQLLDHKTCEAIDFIEKHMKVRTPNGQMQDLNLYPGQERMIDHFVKNDKVIARKSRQVGMTEAAIAFSAYKVSEHFVHNKPYDIFLVSGHGVDGAKHMMERLYQKLHNIGITNFSIKNKLEAKINSNINIKAFRANIDSMRSRRCDLAFIDGADWIDEFEQFLSVMQPSMSQNSKQIISSTPANADNSKFQKMFVKEVEKSDIETDQYLTNKYAKNHGKNVSPKIYTIKDNEEYNYYPAELLWFTNPNYDHNWRQQQIQIIGSNQALYEIDAHIEGI